jgi:hypothetical protein
VSLPQKLTNDTITTQLSGQTPPATNELFSRTTTDDRHVQEKALALIRGNSDSVSNEIDESELQNEKHSEHDDELSSM